LRRSARPGRVWELGCSLGCSHGLGLRRVAREPIIAKPLYGLIPVPRVRILCSTPTTEPKRLRHQIGITRTVSRASRFTNLISAIRTRGWRENFSTQRINPMTTCERQSPMPLERRSFLDHILAPTGSAAFFSSRSCLLLVLSFALWPSAEAFAKGRLANEPVLPKRDS
jgi:hypothetical protein